ncbi:hypothetical protein [Pararhizobium sp.]|uniref:hypothetical protein n=1 Tax=Pararhizobium sp. TaxID=1977563 RepID=UPI003D0C508F
MDIGQYTSNGKKPEQVMLMKADPSWCLFVERIHSTSLDGEFTAIEFELAFAINIRAALRLVEVSPACRRCADVAISNAVTYSCLRYSGRSARVLADAQRQIDGALWRFITELGSCKVKAKADPERTSIYSIPITDRRHAKPTILRRGSHIVSRSGEQF